MYEKGLRNIFQNLLPPKTGCEIHHDRAHLSTLRALTRLPLMQKVNKINSVEVNFKKLVYFLSKM